MGSTLRDLAAHYSQKYGGTVDSAEGLRLLYDRSVKNQEDGIIDAVSATAGINAIFFSDQINMDAVTPRMEEAFRLAFPNRSLEDLNGLSPEAAQGWLNAWKGKLFEVIIRDKLNAGESVGPIQLGAGQFAELGQVANQPGWDLQIFNQDGSVARSLQLKATESLGYIKSAQEKYPDIPIVATEEVAAEAQNVINSGTSNADVTRQAEAPLEDLLDSPLEEFAETVLPGLPFILIATTEGARVLMGRQTLRQAVNRSTERGVTTGVAMGVGYTLATLTGAGVVALPATFATRLGITRVQIYRGLSRRLEADIHSIRLLQGSLHETENIVR